MRNLILNIFGVKFNGDSGAHDRWSWLNKRLPKTYDNLRLLDVGCGNGWSLFLGARRGYSCTGLTWSEHDASKLQERAIIIGARINIITHDARDLNSLEVEDKFDIVVNTENLEHIIDDEKLIKSISARIAPRGFLFLTTPNYFHKLSDRNENGPFNVSVEQGGHVRRGYTLPFLVEMIERHDMIVVEKGFLTGPCSMLLLRLTHLLPWRALQILLMPVKKVVTAVDVRLFRKYRNSGSVFIVAQKFGRDFRVK